MSWDAIGDELRRWHASGDREAGRSALAFLEPELRRMVPVLVRRTWPGDAIEDALRDFLVKVIEVPLPPGIDDLRRYLGRAFRNHCIDVHEARSRRRETPVDDAAGGWESPSEDGVSPATLVLDAERGRHLRAALQRLEIADRIVLKLDHAPELLEDDEVRWLADRAGMEPATIRQAVTSAEDVHDLTRVFDPEDDNPSDPQDRRKRMERFRRRRARARDKLRALLQEGE
jgi:DNA-directed RNA polymerase specialized sigma24 family protein